MSDPYGKCSMRQKLLQFFVVGIIAASLFSTMSCMSEEPFPFPTLAEEIASNTPPTIPANPFPPDGSTNIIRTVILQWQSIDADGEELFFDIFFNIDSIFTLDNFIAESQTDTFFALPSELLANTTYFWKVDVRDETGNWRFGPPWSFTTGSESNNAPQAVILSPADGSQFSLNDPITFRGSAFDVENGVLSGGSLQWISNIDGIIGTDTLLTVSTLKAGIHTITLKATDSGSKIGSDNIRITILDPSAQNIPPSALILSPVDGASIGENQEITFKGTGSDIEDGPLSGADLIWTSSIDGFLGNDTLLLKSDLTKGNHTITLQVTDSGGLSHEQSIQISITQVFNTAPLIQIVEPFSFAPYAVDSLITFTGTAFDIEDGPLTGASVTWTSNRDGLLGTGTSITFTGLSLGFHTIIMTGEDSQGKSSSDQVIINITPIGDENNAPVATISQPKNDEVIIEGTQVTLQGNGIDTEDGIINNSLLRWNSEKDGFLGTGSRLTLPALSLGKHVITLSILDSGGKRDSSIVTFFISAAGNTAPSARFNVEQVFPPPTPGTVNIVLDASFLSDETDALEDIEVRWDFDNDGTFDTQFAAIKSAEYSYAEKNEPHFIKIQVRDLGGLTDELVLIVPEYVKVPAGNFEMGSLTGGPSDEQPRHTVTLDLYYIDKFEVTNWQFAAFLTANRSTAGDHFSSQMSIAKLSDGSYEAVKGLENYPVRYVEWLSAEAFSVWKNKRLPTEAEWAKAARGGQFLDEAKTVVNDQPVRNYPWGTTISLNHANYLIVGRPFDGLAPAGIYTGQLINSVQTINNASPYGAMDMLGNIAEWVSDWYDNGYYSVSPASNPQGPASGSFKIYRGGSFDNPEPELLISKRFVAFPTSRPYNVGFRTVRN